MENTTSHYTIQHLKSCGKTANIVSTVHSPTKPFSHQLICHLWRPLSFCSKILSITWKATEGQNCSCWWKDSYRCCFPFADGEEASHSAGASQWQAHTRFLTIKPAGQWPIWAETSARVRLRVYAASSECYTWTQRPRPGTYVRLQETAQSGHARQTHQSHTSEAETHRRWGDEPVRMEWWILLIP